MKLKNKIPPLTIETVVLPREGEDLVFQAKGVLNADYEDFDKLCPVPKAPWLQRPGQEAIEDVTDEGYQKEVREYSSKRFYYMILKSLSLTEGLEWDTVKMEDSNTWKNFETEMKDHLTSAEYMRVMRAVHSANGLDDAKIEEAKKRFFNTARQVAVK